MNSKNKQIQKFSGKKYSTNSIYQKYWFSAKLFHGLNIVCMDFTIEQLLWRHSSSDIRQNSTNNKKTKFQINWVIFILWVNIFSKSMSSYLNWLLWVYSVTDDCEQLMSLDMSIHSLISLIIFNFPDQFYDREKIPIFKMSL